MSTQDELRKLPSIDRLLQVPELIAAAQTFGREIVVQAVRGALEQTRRAILSGQACPGAAALVVAALHDLHSSLQPTLLPVINATGVILHTNLGRAPLSVATLEAMRRAGEGYSNLEYDLAEGRRGSRYVHAEELLCRLTGAEGALLVNNNAAAVLLVLSTLARGGEVVISRSQLVEIGGGFRIPDVMAQSGARLIEVGTTNRTYLSDYERAIGAETVALLRVHTSNFRISGFTHQPELDKLVELAKRHGIWVFDDLGSGTLIDTASFGLAHEPTIQENMAAGADLVTFSGDKLLGGPQAGIIVGRAELIEQLRHFPLARALRVDKTTIAGLQATLLHYLKGEAETEIPIWRMVALPVEQMVKRAEGLLAGLGPAAEGCVLWPGRSMIGGGSLPEESLPTVLIALPGSVPDSLAAALRCGQPAVVARIENGRVVLDLRTVLPDQDALLIRRLRELLEH